MDHLKKTILLVRHGTTTFNETDRQWAVVDFWNSTSHLENAS